MFDLEVLHRQVGQMKRAGRIWTNNFLSTSTLSAAAAQKESALRYNENALALFYIDNRVKRFCFYLSDLESSSSLAELLPKATGQPVVAECIGKLEDVDRLSQMLCRCGFSPYTRLSRWRSSKIQFVSQSFWADKAFMRASAGDADEILMLLDNVFDPLVSHLPDKDKLLALIDQGLVFCILQEGRIIAVVCLERIGRQGIYLYQDAVIDEYRSTGVGILLLQFALYQFRDCRSFTSWTEDSNTPSNRMHRGLGMAYDGLKDAVLIYR